MELIILGSGTGIPTKRRGSPGFFLRYQGKEVIIDTGSGTLQKMASAGIKLETQKDIFYTHLHPDHCVDLVSILFAKRNPDFLNAPELNLWGGRGLKKYLQELISIYGKWIAPQNYQLNIHEICGPVDLEKFRIIPFPVAHIESSLAYRIETKSNIRMFISGDTDYCDQLIEGAMEVDLAVLECSFPDHKQVKGHLIPRFAAEVVRKAKCKRVVLCHFYPVCDQYDMAKMFKEHYDCDVIVAEDLMRIVL